MKTKLKVGDLAVLAKDYKANDSFVEKGTVFTIKSFPPYVNKSGTFIYGQTTDGRHVRVDKADIDVQATNLLNLDTMSE